MRDPVEGAQAVLKTLCFEAVWWEVVAFAVCMFFENHTVL